MSRSGPKRAAALTALLGLTSCYQWAAIKPTELPKAAAGERDLEEPDGHHTRLDGAAEVLEVVTPRYGATFFKPHATIDDGVLTISGDDRDPVEIPLGQITDARAGRLQPLETAASVVVCIAAVGIGFVVVDWLGPWHYLGP